MEYFDLMMIDTSSFDFVWFDCGDVTWALGCLRSPETLSLIACWSVEQKLQNSTLLDFCEGNRPVSLLTWMKINPTPRYSRLPLQRGPISNGIPYITALTGKEYKSEFQFTKDTPYLALTGELGGVFYEIFFKTDRVITVPHCIYIRLYSSCCWQDRFLHYPKSHSFLQ